MFPQLETERLRLRELTVNDAERVLACFTNELVIRYYGQDKMTRVEEAKDIIHFFTRNFHEKRGVRWGIERKETNELIGTIGLNALVMKHKRAEVGYELHPDYWGLGYASESLASVLSYGFKQLELTRIGAVVFLENEASSRLLLNQGFQREGILRSYMCQNGKPHDAYLYSLINGNG